MALIFWIEASDSGQAKSINKRQPASIANIIQSKWVNSMNSRP